LLATILTALEILYVVGVTGWLLLQKRSPIATMAWILAMAALPVVGLILYFFVGPRRVHKNRLRKLRARLRVRAAAPAPVHSHSEHELRTEGLLKLGARMEGSPPSTCDQLTVLKNGVATYGSIEEAVRAAKHHVHLEYYIFEPDQSGTRLRDLLVERARQGIEVRLLVDAVGSVKASDRFFRPLREAGGKVARFNRVSFARLRPRLLNFRTHRKIVVCDGAVGFTGGVNITDTQNESVLGKQAFRDTHLRLEGAAVRWLQLVFLEDWHYATGHAPMEAVYFPDAPRGPRCVQIVSSGPDHDWEAIRNVYFAAIAAAEQRVLVTTPYFVPDEPMLTALTTAALRGVDVRVMVPRKSDSWLVTIAGRSYFDDLLRAGVHVYEYLPGMLHAKTLVVDRDFAAIGTANMDNRSFRLNFEVSAIAHDEEVAARLTEIFEEDAQHARLAQRRQERLPARLAEAGARLLSPLL
jgi:cardiolipin synthase